MKYTAMGVSLITLVMTTSVFARNSNFKWQRSAKAITALIEHREATPKCESVSFAELSQRFVISRDANGDLCRIFDLSFPTLSSMFAKKPSSSLRVKKPTLADYRSFLNNKTTDHGARSFVEEGLRSRDLDQSWYSKLEFKNKDFNRNADGVISSFKLSDVKMFRKTIAFQGNEKELLTKLLLAYGAKEERVERFTTNPRGFLENINFEYDSLKRAYEVFVDLDFLPVKGPVTSIDHSLHYRAFLQTQIRGLILGAINRMLKPVRSTITGRIASVVINDAFELVNLTYEFQRIQLEQVLRMGIEGTIQTPLTKKELQDSLYLMYVKDSNALPAMITKLAQGGKVDLNNLYPFGKATSISLHNMRLSLSDQNYSKMYYQKKCELESMTYYFARCQDTSTIYSLLSESNFFMWKFGNAKIIDLDRPWAVLTKRTASYLLSSAVSVNFLKFPEWINTRVATALKGYALAGLLDEAYIVSELYEKSTRGIRMSDFQKSAFENILGKSMIPFLPKSMSSLNKIVEGHRQILMSKK